MHATPVQRPARVSEHGFMCPPPQGVAALITTAAVQQARQRAKSADDVDDFVFKEHCKGTRSVSKEGQEIRDA